MARFIDAHAHIHDDDYFGNREEVLSRMRAADVACITVGTHKESSRKAVELAEKEHDVWATIGIHPTDTEEIFDEKDFEEMVESKRVVAIGECGLDYFHEKDIEAREKQKMQFEKQLAFAVKYDKPLMIHCRPSDKSIDAHEEMLTMLRRGKETYGEKLRGNIHFFTGTQDIAEQYIALGFTISFPGVVTFARDVAKVAGSLPLTSILSETDCPYATPVPYRGQKNEPAFVIEIVRKIAEMQGRSIDEVALNIMNTAKQTFAIEEK